MLVHTYNIIIYRGVGKPGHGREVIDGFNTKDKSFISMLMTTVQLPGVEMYAKHITMRNSDVKKCISLERDFKNTSQTYIVKMV